MSDWINTKPMYKHAVKPCNQIGICPYGQLVEEYPLSENPTKRSCKVYGHDCPIFYQAEPFSEEIEITESEIKKWHNELETHFK
jgi:hypothetical protein